MKERKELREKRIVEWFSVLVLLNSITLQATFIYKHESINKLKVKGNGAGADVVGEMERTWLVRAMMVVGEELWRSLYSSGASPFNTPPQVGE